jgi:transposase
MAEKAKQALGFDEIEAIADAGYYRGPDLLACRDIGVTALTPRTNTSRAKAEGRFSKEAFVYLPEEDAYRCPAGQTLTHRYDTVASGLTMRVYWCSTCSVCPMKNQCTPQAGRRIQRWEHENVVETMNARMEAINAMAIRRETAEHPFSTIKAWMGASHFLCKGLKAVRTEMSLNVLAYNIRRMMTSFGAKWLREALAA